MIKRAYTVAGALWMHQHDDTHHLSGQIILPDSQILRVAAHPHPRQNDTQPAYRLFIKRTDIELLEFKLQGMLDESF